jgi:hypothetical protein
MFKHKREYVISIMVDMKTSVLWNVCTLERLYSGTSVLWNVWSTSDRKLVDVRQEAGRRQTGSWSTSDRKLVDVRQEAGSWSTSDRKLVDVRQEAGRRQTGSWSTSDRKLVDDRRRINKLPDDSIVGELNLSRISTTPISATTTSVPGVYFA